MDGKPLVTIAMPVYNGADRLDAALQSLSSQSFPDLRIIISDNASTDATPHIIAAWVARDPRITSFRQNENIGAVANFNWVLHQADSPWVMFACHDDLWSPNYVRNLYQCITAQAGLQLAAPMMTLIRPDNSENSRPFHEPLNKTSGLKRKVLSILQVRSGWYYGLYDRNALLSAWTNLKRFPYAWGGEFIVLLPLLLSGTVTGTNDAVYYKRETPLSAERYKPKTLSEEWGLYSSFLRESWRILQSTPLTFLDRLVLAPLLVLYTDRCAWKLRRLIRNALLKIIPGTRTSR